MGDYVIETNQLTKLYVGNKGCQDITIQVPKGNVYGFLGPNGAGKSTFVRTLLGLIQSTSGTGTILGHPISSLESRKKVGYLPELFRYPDWMTGRQLLRFHSEMCQLNSKQQKMRIEELLDLVGLHNRGDERISGYSKGMQQRIGIACALVSDPEVIFLDEPTSALDPIGRKEVRELIRDLQMQGKTIFLNSHLLSEVETICNHVAIINKGRLIVQGDWRELSAIETQIEITLSGIENLSFDAMPELVLGSEKIRTEKGKESWMLTLKDEESIPELISALTVKQGKLYQVIRQKQNLEDIFMYWINRQEEVEHVANR
ncbi:ABC-2 type transport system ATP-binding protein [Croceifilum oryzae]|uniref:ABC-2 type transport system ATP-binding protein n=1 Tax=Croceifilum oryzae TaxID=1553429 RepID=A0AAJ1WNZ3_9BACL|nr:ABC transporter ATP-binding protein [Croceifilum oryzae]MDQ0416022.1 ABC-2 type transport system ATP-binding protein [Croceifilum oryzae]